MVFVVTDIEIKTVMENKYKITFVIKFFVSFFNSNDVKTNKKLCSTIFSLLLKINL